MKIHPKSRYSQHAQKMKLPPGLIEESISQFDPSLSGAEVQLLSGGFMNSNFLVSKDQRQFVFRVYSSDQSTAAREQGLLSFLEKTKVKAPMTFGLLHVQGHSVGVIEYFNGVTLEDKLLSDDCHGLEIYEEVGSELSIIHSVQFDRAGFLGAGMQIGNEYNELSLFLRSFIDRTLKMLESRPERLGLEINQRFRKLVDDKWNLVLATEPKLQLVHCDFNPKNILVTRGAKTEILAVIDWEFGLSGNGLLDIGNFFRFSTDYPSEAVARFETGYTKRQTLPANWFEVCKLMDLANQCSFLERPEDYQETFQTARTVVKATLEHFGY